MGTELTGREVIAALKKSSADWGTAVACGANDGILISSEGLKMSIEDLVDDSMGSMWSSDSDQGKLSAAGSLEAYMRYDMFEVALALCMGIAGVPSQQESTAAYAGALALADNIVGKYATIVLLKKSDTVFEYPSAKVHGFKLSGSMRQPVKLSLNCILSNEILDSSVNTPSTMGNVTFVDKKNRIIMNADSIFRVNDQTGAALDSDDEIKVTGFDFEFNRPEEGDLTSGNDYQEEPGGTGFPTASLSLKFARFNDANKLFFDNWKSETAKKGDITFTGKTIESTYKYQHKLTFPHMKVSNPEAVANGLGKIPMSVKFNLLAADTAPTGMTGITKPFQLDYINKRTTDPLA